MQHSQEQLDEAMRKLTHLNARMLNLNLTEASYRGLWEVAVREQNGLEETNLREKLHNIMDQCFDVRAESLQLVKKFLSA